jgi:hypothetical protein
MKLCDLVKKLESLPEDKVFEIGFGKPMSYRGNYSELAFEPASNVTVEEMLKSALSGFGDFKGYKGGTYHMDSETWTHVCGRGYSDLDDDSMTKIFSEGDRESIILKAELALVEFELQKTNANLKALKIAATKAARRLEALAKLGNGEYYGNSYGNTMAKLGMEELLFAIKDFEND